MTLTLSWLDIAGLALAFIGFFNLAGPLERFFEGVRDFGKGMRDGAIKHLQKLWPPQAHLPALAWEGFSSAVGVVVFLWINFALDDQVKARWAELMIWPSWATIPLALLAFTLLLFNGMAGYYFWGCVTSVVSTVLWRFFWIIGKAPAGAVGTIGLLVTMASFLNAQVSQGT